MAQVNAVSQLYACCCKGNGDEDDGTRYTVSINCNLCSNANMNTIRQRDEVEAPIEPIKNELDFIDGAGEGTKQQPVSPDNSTTYCCFTVKKQQRSSHG